MTKFVIISSWCLCMLIISLQPAMRLAPPLQPYSLHRGIRRLQVTYATQLDCQWVLTSSQPG